MDNRAIGNYLQPQRNDTDDRWEAIQHHVNQIDGHAQAMGIAPHDLFKKITQPDYTGPNGVNWDKLKLEHKQDRLKEIVKG